MDFLKTTDNLINNYYTASWKSSLPFPNCVLCHKDTSFADESQNGTHTLDLFEYCGNRSYYDWVIRFDPNVYPVPPDLSLAFCKETLTGWRLIQTITLMMARSGQGNFNSNGGKAAWNGQRREIICSRYRVFQKKKVTEDDSSESIPFRDITFRNNQQRQKPIAKKCTTTSLPVDRADKCSCRLMIGVDADSYYIFCGFGNAVHCNHPKVDPSETVTKKRHISLECIETIREFAFCKTTVGSAMLATSFKHDARLSRRQCAHIMTSTGMKAAFQDVDNDKDSTNWTAPEQMFHLFKKKKIFFGMLYHSKDIIESELPRWEAKQRQKRTLLGKSTAGENIPPPPLTTQVAALSKETTSTALLNETASRGNTTHSGISIPSKGACIFETFLPTDDGNDNDSPTIPTILEDQAPLDLADKCRQDFEATDDQDIVLSLVWATPKMRQAFRAYPEVLFIDGTHKTNNEKYPLFTVGIRDADFKVNVVLRAFCPNERAWMFEWFFNEAIPSILGINACKQVKIIITDGDSQETKGLDNAIRRGVFGGAQRRRCGWHIIHQGCKNILFKRFISGNNKSEALKRVVNNMKAWIQESLMKEVEDEREYTMYV